MLVVAWPGQACVLEPWVVLMEAGGGSGWVGRVVGWSLGVGGLCWFGLGGVVGGVGFGWLLAGLEGASRLKGPYRAWNGCMLAEWQDG